MCTMDQDIDRILVSEQELKAKVAELGATISRITQASSCCWFPF